MQLNIEISKSQMLADLLEVRYEITRINQAAGETVFNPTATSALSRLITMIEHEGLETA